MIDKITRLTRLTGLSSDELADALEKNPRAYMAVKGAVAEKHLSRILNKYVESGELKKVQEAGGDFDKDFYITDKHNNLISVECKNVEVIKLGKKAEKINYIEYLEKQNNNIKKKIVQKANEQGQTNYFSVSELNQLSVEELNQLLKLLPQHLRESGIARYQFSANNISNKSCLNINTNYFIRQFDDNMLSIDFQRTRNSTDSDGDPRRKRLYKVGEVDIVAVCLFSRTLQWEFVYAKTLNFDKHKIYSDRYKNAVKINREYWTNNMLDLLSS